jgi:hypothetical protein
MIKTTQPVSYDLIDLSKTATVKASVIKVIRSDNDEVYSLHVEEFIEIPYTAEVPVFDENGNETGTETQNFIKKQVIRNLVRVMTFVEADTLTDALDGMFTITETGTARRKKYTELGHLVINNSENVRNVTWELL